MGNDNGLDTAVFEPHYSQIETSDQVQIYKAIKWDVEGRTITTLLYAASYLKDNRLLL